MHNLQHSTDVEQGKRFIFDVPAEHRSKSGIYIIRNLLNNHVYIGSAIHIRKRCGKHIQHIRARRNACPKLQQAVYKHGIENFQFSVLELCPRELLIVKEQYWIDYYNSAKKGYNSCPVAGTTAGRIVSEETKEKLRQHNLGKKHTTPRIRPLGIPVSDSARKKISEKNKGKKRTPEMCQRQSERMKGRKLSAQIIEKMRISSTGRKHREEDKLKIGLNNPNAKEIHQYTLSGTYIRTWQNSSRLCVATGYLSSKTTQCALGKKKSAYGFIWRYEKL